MVLRCPGHPTQPSELKLGARTQPASPPKMGFTGTALTSIIYRIFFTTGRTATCAHGSKRWGSAVRTTCFENMLESIAKAEMQHRDLSALVLVIATWKLAWLNTSAPLNRPTS